jgi:hypothetical protein
MATRKCRYGGHSNRWSADPALTRLGAARYGDVGNLRNTLQVALSLQVKALRSAFPSERHGRFDGTLPEPLMITRPTGLGFGMKLPDC